MAVYAELGVRTDDRVRLAIDVRRRKQMMFGTGFSADPAWDILLELYATWLEQQRISVGDLCIAARVPATTALRWIAALERQRLIVKRCDPLDGRRVHISLSDEGLRAMVDYFATTSVLPSI